MNEYSYKNRNPLNLSQRVQVIREYDLQSPKPKIQALANKYKVSFPQIKKILLKRESILKSYHERAGDNIHEELHDEFLRQRQEKIQFLGKVMYEYIQRILYHKLIVDDEKVLQKAIEVKECIAVVNFRPTHLWLADFKKTYGIPSFDLETLRNNITLMESKRPQLTVFDLIAHVSRLEKKPCKGNASKKKVLTLLNATKTTVSTSPITTTPSVCDHNKETKCERMCDDDIDIKPPIIACNSLYTPKDNRQESENNKCQHIDYSMCEVESLEEALKHLRLLEEYAMLKDNYRAIGLLTQLEFVFKNPQ